MLRVLWNLLVATPALLSTLIFASASAAQPAVANAQFNQPVAKQQSLDDRFLSDGAIVAQAISATSTQPGSEVQSFTQQVEASSGQAGSETKQRFATLDQIAQSGNWDAAHSSLAQVTSVSQLSDVRPTDWAYQALQSLVERYGCIVGYPDRTYKGSRALTRYEFAAGLNACLDRISELIASSTANLATKEDLATIQRLQEEFAAELASLRGRVDSLEARTATLEANQFSTTTKLRGEVLFAVGVPITEDDSYDDQTIGGYRIRLNFDTSFSGKDLLRARLQARAFNDFFGFGGNVGALSESPTSWSFSNQKAGIGPENQIVLNKLFYSFPATNRIQVSIGATGFADTDFVTSTINPLDDGARGSVFKATPAQYSFVPGGVGAGAIVQLANHLSLDFGYAATSSDGPNPSPGAGLFNGDYGVIAQLTYLSKFVDAALTYAHGYRSAGFFTQVGVEGHPEVANTYGGQVNFKFGQFQIGGGGAYIPIRSLGRGDYDAWAYQFTLALRDLGGAGNLFGILAEVTPYAAGVPASLVTSNAGINQHNNFVVEGFYRFKVNDNIYVTPSVFWLSNPDNDGSKDSTVVGALRTTFVF